MPRPRRLLPSSPKTCRAELSRGCVLLLGVRGNGAQGRQSRDIVKRGRDQERPHLDETSLAALLSTHVVASRSTMRDQTPPREAAEVRRDLDFRLPNITLHVLTTCRLDPTKERFVRSRFLVADVRRVVKLTPLDFGPGSPRGAGGLVPAAPEGGGGGDVTRLVKSGVLNVWPLLTTPLEHRL